MGHAAIDEQTDVELRPASCAIGDTSSPPRIAAHAIRHGIDPIRLAALEDQVGSLNRELERAFGQFAWEPEPDEAPD